jgi:hypothetical protein
MWMAYLRDLSQFWITNRRLNNSYFVRWEDALTEGILAIILFEYSSLFDCHAEKEAHCVWMEYRCVPLRLSPYSIFMVAKDYNAGFGPVRIHHLIWFDGEDAHGRYCSWGSFLSQTAIFCQS